MSGPSTALGRALKPTNGLINLRYVEHIESFTSAEGLLLVKVGMLSGRTLYLRPADGDTAGDIMDDLTEAMKRLVS